MNNAVRLANEASVSLLRKLRQLFEDGYEIWDFWMPYPEGNDKVVVIGCMSLVKYETDKDDASRSKGFPSNQGNPKLR